MTAISERLCAVSPVASHSLTWLDAGFDQTVPFSTHFLTSPDVISDALVLSPTPSLAFFPRDDCLFGDGGFDDELASSPLDGSTDSSFVHSPSSNEIVDSIHLSISRASSCVPSTSPVSVLAVMAVSAESTAAATTRECAATASAPLSVTCARPRFLSRKVACQVCHFAKVRCEGGRPCERCIRHSHTQHCTDRPSTRTERDKRKRAQQTHSGRAHTKHTPTATALEPEWSERGDEDAATDRGGAIARQPFPFSRTLTSSSSRSSGSSDSDYLIRHLPLPFSARHLPLDAARFSSYFVSGHIRWLSQLSVADLGSFISKMHLREKLLQKVWMSSQLTPSDMQTLAHAAPSSPTWWHHYFEPRHHQLLQDGYRSLRFRRHSGSATQSSGGEGGHTKSDSPPARTFQLCDGVACFGFCGFLDAMTEAASCRISWELSPTLPLSDLPDRPNQPFIIIRRLDDEAVTRRQEALVNALCNQLVSDMAAARISDGDNRSSTHTADSDDSGLQSASVAVNMSVLCNAAFERLLGFKQVELRELFSNEGEKALFGLVSSDNWPSLLQLDKELRLGWREEGRLLLTAINKWRERVACVLSMQCELDCRGKPLVTYFSFVPLPTDGRVRHSGSTTMM